VFLILCKGLKSLGKLAYIIYTLPLVALAVVTAKFVYVVDPSRIQVSLLPEILYVETLNIIPLPYIL